MACARRSRHGRALEGWRTPCRLPGPWPRGDSGPHLVLAPSEYEGFGIAVLEAMATGTPVVANGIDAHRELIEPGVNGLLVDFADAGNALGAVVNALQLPPPDVAALGDQARAAAARFAWDRVVDQVEQVYRDTVAGG